MTLMPRVWDGMTLNDAHAAGLMKGVTVYDTNTLILTPVVA